MQEKGEPQFQRVESNPQEGRKEEKQSGKEGNYSQGDIMNRNYEKSYQEMIAYGDEQEKLLVN